MISLLSRYAESIFWLARYVERAENLARLLEVNEIFARDGGGGQNWLSIVQLNADEERFLARHRTATSAAVRHFYLVDPENPTSILSTVRAARENARTLRPLISTEMWTQLNIFHNRLMALATVDVGASSIARHCTFVKESCQTHTGITEGTFYRDQGWYFYELGRYVERADQTTRLLDIKYHILLPRPADVGSPVDISQWNALLRSASGYHAYRRVYPRGISPESVAGFLLLNPAFPRSVTACVDRMNRRLSELKSRYLLRGGNAAMEIADEIRAELAGRTIERIIGDGLHEYVDWIQLRLIDFTAALGQSFFGWTAPASEAENTQS